MWYVVYAIFIRCTDFDFYDATQQHILKAALFALLLLYYLQIKKYKPKNVKLIEKQ